MNKAFVKININRIIQTIIIILISTILFSSIIVNYRSFDTYRIEVMQGLHNYAKENSFNDGRIFMGLICLTANAVNMNVQALVTIDAIAAIIIFSICVIYLKEIILNISKNKKIEYFILILSFSVFFNFIMIDAISFLESIVIATSVLLYTIAAKKIVIDNKNILGIVLTVLGIFCYQATIYFFLQLVVIFTLLTKKDIKKVLQSIVIALLAIAINYLYIKGYEYLFNYSLNRLNINIISNIIYMFTNINQLLVNSLGLFPKYLWLIFLCSIFLIAWIYSIKRKENYVLTLKLIAITIFCIIISVSILIISQLEYLTSGRAFFAIGSLIPILLIYIAIETDILKEKTLKYAYICVIALFSITNVLNIYHNSYSFKKANDFDRYICESIVKYIEKYEKENNVIIENVDICISSSNMLSSNFLKKAKPIAYSKSYVLCYLPIQPIIKLYTNRNFDTGSKSKKEIEELFKDRGFDSFFNDKNIEFINNEAYIFIN